MEKSYPQLRRLKRLSETEPPIRVIIAKPKPRRFIIGIVISLAVFVFLGLSAITIEASITGKTIPQVVRHYLGMESAEVTVTAVPLFGLGDLTATYVNDNLVRLDWGIDENIAKTMIRAKYDEAPESITDGYQVYYDNSNQAFDTGVNLNETFSTIYYVAFAQDPEDNWLPISREATMESPHMAELSTTLSTFISTLLILILLLAFNGLVFWKRHIFLYLLALPVNVVYGFYMASDTVIYSTSWVIGIIIAIVGVFCLFQAVMKLVNRD
jgi:hypothetical protein